MNFGNKGRRPGQETPRYDRRRFIWKAGGLVLSAALAADIFAPGPATALAGRRRISLGTFAPSHCSIPMVHAQLRDYFKDAGLPVTQTNYSDMTLLAKDLVSGRLDFGQLIVPLVFAIHTGQNALGLKAPMAICQITGTNGAALMVKKGSGITGPEDFKGKTMANHSKLSVHYLINRMFLETHGLDFQHDVQFKVINLADAVTAMETGEVDTFVMPEPRDALAEAKGIGEVYLLSKYIWPNHPCCSLVTRKELFDQERDLVTDVTRAVTKSGLFVNQPQAREQILDTLQSVPDYQFDKVPREVLKKALTPGRSDFYPFPYQSTAMLIIEIMKKYDLLATDLDARQTAAQVFQSGLSRQVMRELGADPPETDYRVEKILGALKDYAI